MRGERYLQRVVSNVSGGSSPHARGTRIISHQCYQNHRFIPACAGNAKLAGSSSTGGTVHPRMRGERLAVTGCAAIMFGSSPHARGTRLPAIADAGCHRFIPACAGNAGRRSAIDVRFPVHPRMRGERAFRSDCGALAGGSSPHARGTLRQPCNVAPGGRFIPACAGNARPSCGSRPRRTVHPRMRGERLTSVTRLGGLVGSSPHARGTLMVPRGLVFVGRFIPACAGNAFRLVANLSNFPVHPRMRGERVNGHGIVIEVGRFIPACAGNAPGVSRRSRV